MIDVLGPEKRRRRTTQEKIAIVSTPRCLTVICHFHAR
ncbi:insertion sequence protein [Shigella sonnei 4822-66]|nr:hypothetical protein SS53G_4459 [Shigella sonnei 53G]EIQ53610.1 insertion sequence protein [Shigella sonnei 4822-66]